MGDEADGSCGAPDADAVARAVGIRRSGDVGLITLDAGVLNASVHDTTSRITRKAIVGVGREGEFIVFDGA